MFFRGEQGWWKPRLKPLTGPGVAVRTGSNDSPLAGVDAKVNA